MSYPDLFHQERRARCLTEFLDHASSPSCAYETLGPLAMPRHDTYLYWRTRSRGDFLVTVPMDDCCSTLALYENKNYSILL